MTAISDQVSRRRLLPYTAVAVIATLAGLVIGGLFLGGPRLGAQQRREGAFFIPGDPKSGIKIFFEKGCIRCHSILGEGGRTAPDLARTPARHLGAAELVAAMWNHAPAMWEKMTLERLTAPEFSTDEMTDLFAFLYSVRSLDEPGDPDLGRQFLRRKCLACHSVEGSGGRLGPDLREWVRYRNPVSWIQAMWNHALPMQAAMARRGLDWPQLASDDMANLMAYLRTMATGPGDRVYLGPAEPDTGRRLFRSKGCAACHAIRGAGGRRGPDLGLRSLPRTLGQFATLMWNHAPAMTRVMAAEHVRPAQFTNQEMADLIAYLFSERYFEVRGSAAKGARSFEDKGCSGCHGPGADADSPAVSLEGWRGRASPLSFAAALWNHGPVMLASMQQRNLPWPRFRAGEMSDLMEFLSSGRPSKRTGARE